MAIDEAGQPLLEAVLPAVGFVDVDAPQPGQVVERAGSLPRTVQRDEVVEDRVDALGKESVDVNPDGWKRPIHWSSPDPPVDQQYQPCTRHAPARHKPRAGCGSA